MRYKSRDLKAALSDKNLIGFLRPDCAGAVVRRASRAKVGAEPIPDVAEAAELKDYLPNARRRT